MVSREFQRCFCEVWTFVSSLRFSHYTAINHQQMVGSVLFNIPAGLLFSLHAICIYIYIQHTYMIYLIFIHSYIALQFPHLPFFPIQPQKNGCQMLQTQIFPPFIPILPFQTQISDLFLLSDQPQILRNLLSHFPWPSPFNSQSLFIQNHPPQFSKYPQLSNFLRKQE